MHGPYLAVSRVSICDSRTISLYLLFLPRQKQILYDVALVSLHSSQPHKPTFSASTHQVVSRQDRPARVGRWAGRPLARGRHQGRAAALGFAAAQSGRECSCCAEDCLLSFREFCHEIRRAWGSLVPRNSEVVEIWRSILAARSESGKALN